MIEPLWLLLGLLLPAVASVAVLLATRHRRCPAWLSQSGPSLAIATGFVVGYTATYGTPVFPPVESQQWLLTAVLPATLIVSILGAINTVPSPIAWIGRLALALGTPPLLLQSYLRYTWSTGQAFTWIASLGVAIATVWALLSRLDAKYAQAQTPSTRWWPLLLAIVAGGTGIAIMMSGSQTIAQLGLTLAAVLVAVLILPGGSDQRTPRSSPIDIPFAVLVGLWLNGYFYAELLAWHTALLVLASLMPWVGLIPALRNRPPWQNTAIRLIATAIPIIIVIATAAIRFNREMTDYYG